MRGSVPVRQTTLKGTASATRNLQVAKALKTKWPLRTSQRPFRIELLERAECNDLYIVLYRVFAINLGLPLQAAQQRF